MTVPELTELQVAQAKAELKAKAMTFRISRERQNGIAANSGSRLIRTSYAEDLFDYRAAGEADHTRFERRIAPGCARNNFANRHSSHSRGARLCRIPEGRDVK